MFAGLRQAACLASRCRAMPIAGVGAAVLLRISLVDAATRGRASPATPFACWLAQASEGEEELASSEDEEWASSEDEEEWVASEDEEERGALGDAVAPAAAGGAAAPTASATARGPQVRAQPLGIPSCQRAARCGVA
jgi:hypothetical protein